ncbi:MAG: hypothetical protein ACE5K2_09750 [Candidatus Zixiibacteriota bacterium]
MSAFRQTNGIESSHKAGCDSQLMKLIKQIQRTDYLENVRMNIFSIFISLILIISCEENRRVGGTRLVLVPNMQKDNHKGCPYKKATDPA